MELQSVLKTKIALALFSLSLSTATLADTVGDYREAVREAVMNNPSVKAAWYAFKAAEDEQRVAQGGYYPDVDLTMDGGKRWTERPGVSEFSYNHRSASLTLTQMLFDGFETRYQVSRLGHEKRARYFEFKQAAEDAALEASRAYLDVAREQILVELTKENYIEHRKIYDQILQRAEGGVSRGVDLEQANGRLSLAETNLLTELTNLHDVSARFQRVVGYLPDDTLKPITVDSSMIPGDRMDVLKTAYQENHYLLSTVEGLYAADASMALRDAAFMPKLDLRLSQSQEKNRLGASGTYNDRAAELVLTYNLYNGGSDSATKRQYANLKSAATERRLEACRNVRQEAMIAYNNISSLQEKLGYLDDNQLAISKARVAYRSQFDIGQRTLLDLLDTENEYFETRRALVNAEHDLSITQARTLAAMGLLVASLEEAALERKADDITSPASEDYTICPLQAPTEYTIDKDALFASLMAGSDRYVATDRGLEIELNVTFAHNSSQITEAFDAEIANTADILKQNAALHVIIEGHTDSTGPDQYNEWLSRKRASAVAERMIDKYGVNPEQLETRGMGESQPIADNDSEEGRQMNRRVILVIPSDTASDEGRVSAVYHLNLSLPEETDSSGNMEEFLIAAKQ
ncbi:MAG: hypothetical protein RL336_728 [Pseudomonadota bacterium]